MVKKRFLLSIVGSVSVLSVYAASTIYPDNTVKMFRKLVDQYNESIAIPQLSSGSPLVEGNWKTIGPGGRHYLQARIVQGQKIEYRFKDSGNAILNGVTLTYQFNYLKKPAGSGITPITSSGMVSYRPVDVSGVSPSAECIEVSGMPNGVQQYDFMAKSQTKAHVIDKLLKNAGFNCTIL